jgi:hypothetical protein
LISTLQVASSFRALGGFSSANKNRKTLNLKVQTTRKKDEMKTDHVSVYKKLKQAGRIKRRYNIIIKPDKVSSKNGEI